MFGTEIHIRSQSWAFGNFFWSGKKWNRFQVELLFKSNTRPYDDALGPCVVWTWRLQSAKFSPMLISTSPGLILMRFDYIIMDASATVRSGPELPELPGVVRWPGISDRFNGSGLVPNRLTVANRLWKTYLIKLITLIEAEQGWEISWLKTNVKIILEEVEFRFLQVLVARDIPEAKVVIMSTSDKAWFSIFTDTMIDESYFNSRLSLTAENHLKGRRISHPDNSPSRRTQHWSYQISGDSLEQIARERLAAGNTTGNSTANSTGNTTGSSNETSNANSSSTSNSPLASISNSTIGGRTVHHSFHVPERSFPGKCS